MNLRKYMDGAINVNQIPVPSSSHVFKAQDDVIIRRKTHRTGPTTNEVIAGKILAMQDDTAIVTIQNAAGSRRVSVPVSELAPVTETFRRNSSQFNTAFRQRI